MTALPSHSAFARPAVVERFLNDDELARERRLKTLDSWSAFAKTSAAFGPEMGDEEQHDSFMAPHLGGRL